MKYFIKYKTKTKNISVNYLTFYGLAMSGRSIPI